MTSLDKDTPDVMGVAVGVPLLGSEVQRAGRDRSSQDGDCT